MEKKQAGVTLVELMIAIIVLSIIAAAGIPAFTAMLETNRRAARLNELVTSIYLARSEAVERGASVTVCPRATSTACASGDDYGSNQAIEWENGWLVAVRLADDSLEVIQDVPAWQDSKAKMRNRIAALNFKANGLLLSGLGTFVYCNKTSDSFAATKIVAVSLTGRPEVRASSESNSCG